MGKIHKLVYFLPQFRVEVSDQSIPEKKSQAEIQVWILKNKLPVFINTPYTVTVPYNQVINRNIFTVKAIDDDLLVRRLTFSQK